RRGLLVNGTLTLVTTGLAALCLELGVTLLGLAGPGDPAGLPWLALVTLALGLGQLPLTNGFSRWIERQADDFALATTDNAAAFDGISARLVQDAGFPAVYMTGYGTAASRLGLPDLGFAGLGEMADHARNLAGVLDVPLIADADTGYGNALNVRRTVQAYEAAGVAALHIEDQITPKRCGHLSGHQIVPRGEFVGKIR